MGGSTYTPRQQNWHWYSDALAEPTAAQSLANENVKPTLPDNTNKVRLRVCIAEIGGKADTNVTISLQYDTDSAFPSPQSMGAAPQHWNYANGLGTEGSQVTSQLLSDASTRNEYCESGTNSVSIGASSTNELDVCIVPTTSVASNTTYYFRIVGDGTAIPLNTGETYPQVLTANIVNQTISAGLCAGAGSMLSESFVIDQILSESLLSAIGTMLAENVSGDANITTGLIACTGTPYTVTVDIGQTVNVGLISASGTVYSVSHVIDHNLTMGLASAVGSVLSEAIIIDCTVLAGLQAAIGNALSTAILSDVNITTNLLAGTTTVNSVVVVIEGGDVTVNVGLVSCTGTPFTISFSIDQILTMNLLSSSGEVNGRGIILVDGAIAKKITEGFYTKI